MANMNELNGAIKGRNPLSAQCMPTFAKNEASEAVVWVENGKYIPSKSFPSLADPVPEGEMSGLAIHANLERINGFVAAGDAWEPAEYTLRDSKIELDSCGCSDFTSRGAGALAFGGGTLHLVNVDIVTRGAGRCATIVTENATLRAWGCRFSSYGGPLPADYKPVIGPGMMEPPWPLGLSGNARTHLSMDGSRAFFDHCTFYAADWGAISTDSSGGCLYLEANDCRITVEGNGYGTYADNGCHNVFNYCDFMVGDVLAIQDGNSSLTFRETSADCGKNAFMLHGALKEYVDVGIIDIQGGFFKAQENIFYAKSANVDIYVKEAELYPVHGAILKSICNDDPMYYEMAAKGPECYGVQATFEGMKLQGNILHEDTDRRMRVSLVNTTLSGAITGSPVLRLYKKSKWTATGDSSVVLEQAEDIGSIDAVRGVTIQAEVPKGTVLYGSKYLASGGELKITANG